MLSKLLTVSGSNTFLTGLYAWLSRLILIIQLSLEVFFDEATVFCLLQLSLLAVGAAVVEAAVLE